MGVKVGKKGTKGLGAGKCACMYARVVSGEKQQLVKRSVECFALGGKR